MKNIFKIQFISALLVTCITTSSRGQVPGIGLVTGLIKKVIIAIDLKVQQLQNKTIALQNAEQQLENNLSLNRLNDISGWLGKEKDLYHDYYQELSRVKTVITDRDEVRSIISRQNQLLAEYRSAHTLYQQDKNFSPNELAYMETTYGGILKESSRNLEELLTAITSFTTRMDDAERLFRVQQVSAAMQINLDHLRQFNQQNKSVSQGRALDQQDHTTVRELYGIK